MARDFGRILSRIWDDKDFLALESGPQRLYCFLVTQANLNHAGLLPMTLRKWAKKAPDLTPEVVLRDLRALAAARFVVVDEDSEEVLIRTFIRNDNVYKMPRVMGSAVSGALEIESHRLRRALLLEMDRIPLDELSTEPSKTKSGGPGPSIRHQVWGHIETLRDAFKNLDPEPWDRGSSTPDEPLPEGVTEGVNEPPSEGDSEGVWGNARARGPAPARTSPSPSPTPAPTKELPLEPSSQPPILTVVPSQPLASLAPIEGEVIQGELIPSPSKAVAKRTRKAAAAKQPDPLGDAAQEITVAFFERHKGRNAQPFPAIRGVVKTALERDVPRDVIAAAMDNVARAGWGISGNTLTNELNRMWNAANGGDQGGGNDLGSDAHMNRYLARAAARKARGA